MCEFFSQKFQYHTEFSGAVGNSPNVSKFPDQALTFTNFFQTKAYVAQPPAAGPVQPVFAPQPAYAPQPVAYAPQPGYAPQPVPEIQPGLAPNSGFVPPMEQPPAYSPPGETTPMYPVSVELSPTAAINGRPLCFDVALLFFKRMI